MPKNLNQKEEVLICEKCNHPNVLNIKPLKTRRNKKQSDNNNNIYNNDDDEIFILDNVPSYRNIMHFPICIETKHRGFWITNSNGIHVSTTDIKCDRNSVMFTNDCLLYIYKLALRHFLLSMKIINPSDIDAANLVPHMVIRKNNLDPFSKYDEIQNKKYVITDSMISVRNDFMLIEIDEQKDLHFTLIYKKKIKEKINLLKALKTVIAVLNEYPNLINEYGQLSYFGQDAINYWYDVPESYPFNIIPPANYERKVTSETIYPETTSAGSIIR